MPSPCRRLTGREPSDDASGACPWCLGLALRRPRLPLRHAIATLMIGDDNGDRAAPRGRDSACLSPTFAVAAEWSSSSMSAGRLRQEARESPPYVRRKRSFSTKPWWAVQGLSRQARSLPPILCPALAGDTVVAAVTAGMSPAARALKAPLGTHRRFACDHPICEPAMRR